MYINKVNLKYKQVVVPKGIRKKGGMLFDVFQATVKDLIMPAVAELENRCLLDGFYIMNHAGLDLRLAAKDWNINEDQIRKILDGHGIHGPLVDYEYAGADVNKQTHLTDAFLRFNTKLLFSYLKLKEDGFEEESIGKWIPLRPAFYAHYLFNQWGYRNVEEAVVYDYCADSQYKIGYFNHQIGRKSLRNVYWISAKLNAYNYLQRIKIDIKEYYKWLRKGK